MVTKLAIKNKKVHHLTFPVHTHILKYMQQIVQVWIFALRHVQRTLN